MQKRRNLPGEDSNAPKSSWPRIQRNFSRGTAVTDLKVQRLNGRPVLTWWEGQLFVGDGDGVGQVYDSNYKPIAQVRTGNGYTFDLHEFTITPRNTALVIAYERYNRSLTAWGGPRSSPARGGDRGRPSETHPARAARW